MKAIEKVEAHIADALKKGAKVVIGGKRAAQGGSFFEPTVLTDVTTDMVITKEETFGPVAPLYRFKGEADAVKMANDTEFGLAAYFYSRDIGRIWRVAEALEYGIVGINEGIISTEIAPCERRRCRRSSAGRIMRFASSGLVRRAAVQALGADVSHDQVGYRRNHPHFVTASDHHHMESRRGERDWRRNIELPGAGGPVDLESAAEGYIRRIAVRVVLSQFDTPSAADRLCRLRRRELRRRARLANGPAGANAVSAVATPCAANP